MLKLRFLSCALIVALLLSSCSAGTGITEDGSVESQGAPSSDGSAASPQAAIATTTSSKVKDEDLDASWDETTATKIILNGGGIDVNGSGASVSGSVVTIGSAGTYVVSGALTDGQIAVNAPENALVRLVLNGVELSNLSTSPIYCEQADKLLIILADGSTNTITDPENYVFPNADTDEPNAAVFSDTDMTINGTGELTVNANYNNGIGTKDDLMLVSGTLIVTAPNDAVRGRDSVTVMDAGLTLNAGGDGIQANNDSADDKGWIELYGGSYDITAAHDGIQAETWLTVAGGDFRIVAGGGSAFAPERASESRGGVGRQGGMMNPPPEAVDRSQMPPELPDNGGRMPPEPPDNGGQMPPASDTVLTDTTPVETMLTGTAAESDDASEDTDSDSFKAIKAGTDLVIAGGSFVIDSADDALHANGNVSVSGGELTISTGDDGIHADAELIISGSPQIDILASYEGIEGAAITILGGDINVMATDDAINAAGGAGGSEGGAFGQDRFNSGSGEYWIRVEGGNINIATGVDGIDSNGDIYISGGVITFNMTNLNAVGGDGMLDNDGTMTITGGTILGAGGNGIVTMGRGSGDSSSTQPILQLYYTDTQAAGTLVEIKNAAGDIVAGFTPERDFKCIIISASELRDGESYSVYTGGEKTLDLTLSGSVTSLQDTGEAASQTMGGRTAGRGDRSAASGNP